ncbi:unnamed protein product [Sphenostylis stenocarpa]|uniref:MYB-CC type transcription factor LHEQLE-containing domain-containing protein n=1 Tax=Sphenostylis stenocarpa TaxID=92480 RepID=A0AA86SBP4_9FABA|nr:unnamed protein product [Sphenostylis stenocarpa]
MDPINLTNNPNLASRQRLRWTNELHERFVDAVAQLGGPDPKYLPDSSLDGQKGDKKETGDTLSSIDGSPGMQITEALKLQMEVQKRLHEQLEVQRQLQLRIEAQGKYLRKIIEEQQRLGGVLSEVSDSGVTAPVPGDMCQQEPDDKTDPATPAPTSECLLEKASKEHAPDKSLSMDESFSSHHEPMTPDSCCHVGSPTDNPKGERSTKKQRLNMEAAYSEPELVLPLEISSMSSYHRPNAIFVCQEQFGPSLGMSAGSVKALEQDGNSSL